MSDTYNLTDDLEHYQALRVREANAARKEGHHYWLATTLHKIREDEAGPGNPLILDQENFRGVLVSCGVCGATDIHQPCEAEAGG